ncbi:anthranilate synthase component II [Psychrosphaera haliotis]|uniref:Anthranilate/aminodeoxychorismate synthase component II n=1 Tax=Psychrosphaera haliotis TaxID=555083 RepID=A0A6N8F9H0_9GAMM|nr:aminodeoxychorismate/anthranilate synthase component II [Psychrosphaera haliotis]MUH73083.1 anthranilate/aminodeoxychorismate synthase component II [Psychrosphaera haliotis]
MLLMIDNYDSFTYTLVNYFESLDQEVVVKRNDDITIDQIKQLNPTQIVISPGPRSPNEAGISLDVVANFYHKKPILGVCLGHQVIAQQFGAQVKRAKQVMHGKTSIITHSKKGMFQGLPNPLSVTRYHSLIVDHDTLPTFIEPTAWVETESQVNHDELMAMAMKEYPVMGVQFHPESVMSESGLAMLNNFVLTTK